MRNCSLSFFLIAAGVLQTYNASAQSPQFEAAKMLEIQTAVLRVLNSTYVDSVSAGDLIETGIHAMMDELDPYTVFIPEEEEEELDMMTTGSYGGVGAVIKKTPAGEVMVSQPYSGSPAVKEGLRPGDLILRIDTADVKPLSVTECSSRMRGTPGTDFKMTVRNGKTGDTAVIDLKRERIHIPDVSYSGFIDDTTGFIQLTGFTLGGSDDFRKAFCDLKDSGHLKQLVIDLRNNGGGLMSEAVNILSIFLPKHTMVLFSKGRDSSSVKYEYTENEPVDTLIPLVVLVDGGTASSSEIVSGALQDLDRAVIAGTRTFGKGLIQSILNTGYGSSVKVTAARYYIPSGRCVQAIDYSHRNADGSIAPIPDSLRKAFKTAGGRTVYDGGGITPDIVVETEYLSRPVAALYYADIPGEFAIKYYTEHDSVASPASFKLTDEDYADFIKFASGKEFDARTESQIAMEQVLKAAAREGLTDRHEGLQAQMDSLMSAVTLDKERFLIDNREVIGGLIEEEIMSRYYFTAGQTELSLRYDKQLKEALKQVKEKKRE